MSITFRFQCYKTFTYPFGRFGLLQGLKYRKTHNLWNSHSFFNVLKELWKFQFITLNKFPFQWYIKFVSVHPVHLAGQGGSSLIGTPCMWDLMSLTKKTIFLFLLPRWAKLSRIVMKFDILVDLAKLFKSDFYEFFCKTYLEHTSSHAPYFPPWGEGGPRGASAIMIWFP